MKKTVLKLAAVALFVPSLAMAQPTLYECTSTDDSVRVGMTTTSFAGTPTITVEKDGVTRTAMTHFNSEARTSGSSLTTMSSVETPHGTLVSLMDQSLAIADGPVLIFSIVIPHIRHSINPVKFSSILLEGTQSVFTHPAYPQQSMSSVTSVNCTGSNVLF